MPIWLGQFCVGGGICRILCDEFSWHVRSLHLLHMRFDKDCNGLRASLACQLSKSLLTHEEKSLKFDVNACVRGKHQWLMASILFLFVEYCRILSTQLK